MSQPPYGPADPEYVAPDPLDPTPGDRVVSVAMIALPLLCCGFLAFVPSLWVAWQRRSKRRLLVRALLTSAVLLVGAVAGGLVLDLAPVDSTGDPSSWASIAGVVLILAVAATGCGLAIVQRRPRDALRPDVTDATS